MSLSGIDAFRPVAVSMISRTCLCDYCKRPSDRVFGNCDGCGAPLPGPKETPIGRGYWLGQSSGMPTLPQPSPTKK
jgi:hypothetical protein